MKRYAERVSVTVYGVSVMYVLVKATTVKNQQLTLLCISHLHWDHVWQRPQHLMSRFATHCNVIFVDPPEIRGDIEQPQLTEREGCEGVRVLRPMFPDHLVTSARESFRQLWLNMLPEVLTLAGDNIILWVFSPLADYLVQAAQGRVLFSVYDCMDDLASFRGAAAEMRMREEHLLRLVDLVFTGGRSMYEARQDRHPHVYCFPSGVDIAHYRQVRDRTLHEPASMQHVPHPRLGYFGVLDERLDWPLIGEIARRRPDWQWVLVGPTAKVDASELPHAPNILYCGQQSYAALPSFLEGFDIATMPFVLNEATRFISPTKTLEYLAGGKPVISSSVPDVVATYPDVVTIADGVDAWIAALDAMLAEPVDVRQQRLERAQPLLDAGSWDDIAARMWALMEARLAATSITANIQPVPARNAIRSA
jgi:glycosyltransferase involved in cell wall biosynthesis